MKENNKYRLLWTAIGLLLMLNITLLVWVAFFSHNFPIHPDRLFLAKELKFDEKQSQEYGALREEHATQVRELRDEVKNLKKDFFEGLNQTNISEDTLRAKTILIESKMAEVDLLTFKHFQKVRQMCSTFQKKQFDKIIIDLIGSLDDPRGGGPPPRDGNFPNDRMPPPPPER